VVLSFPSLACCQPGPFELENNRVGPWSQLERSLEIPSFLGLGVDASVAHRLVALGITQPLPIQSATIPDALAGRDICGRAPTGSGKTLAFGIPLVAAATGSKPGSPRGLVLVPTRELADQVRSVLSSLLGGRGERVVALYGGTGYVAQRRALSRGVDIVVACPGRLEDLVARGDVRLGDVRTVVLDEADRMVDMGFLRPVCRLLDQTAKGRQILLFSATLDGEVASISRKYQDNPATHEVQAEPATVDAVTHEFWQSARTDRVRITAQLIAQHGQAFVFCRTKRGADRVAQQLRAAGVEAAPIHGDRSQPQRARALASFAAGRTHALVATDVVARGIHVDDVPCVVHFDPASDATAYVHRSGRTGRLGQRGTVVSLVPTELHDEVRALQRALGVRCELTAPFSARPVSGDPVSSRPAPPAPVPRGAAEVSARRPSSAPAAARRATRSPTNARRPAAAPSTERRRSSSAGLLTGTVKFFDTARGFGFLSHPDGSEVFVHHSTIRGSNKRMLRTGERVQFEVALGRRGHEARNVTTSQAAPGR
jgi:superfamily II DNA/RNA helicase